MDKIQLLSIVGSLILFFSIIYLIRVRKLKIQYSLIWLFASVVILIFSVNRSLLEKTAEVFNVHYPPSFLFFIALFFILSILLHFSLIISKLSEQNKILAQKLTLLKKKAEDGEKKIT